MQSLLRSNGSFRLLWFGQLVSQIGTKVYLLALAWYFVHERLDPAGLVGVLLAGSLPLLVLGPLAGPMVDRIDRRRILIGADLGSALLALGIALAVHLGLAKGWIFGAVALLSLCEVCFNPAARALVPALVGPDRVQEATSDLSMVYNLASLAGAAGGGALVGWFGVLPAILINAGSFLVSALASWRLRAPAQAPGGGAGFWRDLGDGLAYVRRHTLVFRMLVVSALLNLFFVAIVVYLPVLVSGVLGLGARQFGWAEACAPVGSLVAALVLARQRTEAHLAWFRTGVLFLGAAFLVVAAGRSYVAVLGAMALIGLTLSTVNIHSVSFFTKAVEGAYLGRFFNLMETISFGTFPLAYLLAGLLVRRVDLYLLFLAHGLALAGLGALGFRYLRDARAAQE